MFIDARRRIMTRADFDELIFDDVSENALQSLARRLGPALGPHDVVALEGPLGSGKTTFARALIRAWLDRPDEEVPSPTFLIVQPYRHPIHDEELWHVDLYRISSPGEALELGLDEALEKGPLVIEWPDQAEGMFPDPSARLELSHSATENRRRLKLILSSRASDALREQAKGWP